MSTAMDQLRNSDLPLTIERIAQAIEATPATVQRVIRELGLPASYFSACYSLPTIRLILDRLTAEQLAALADNNTTSAGVPKNAKTKSQPRTLGPDPGQFLDAYARRRDARIKR